jgi:hypothetical protein
MPRTKEEIKAELVWRFVECLREEEDPSATPIRFAREELDELVGVLETAGDLPEVLVTAESETARETVRGRLEDTLRAAEAAPASKRGPRPSHRPSIFAAMQFRMVTGVVMGVALAVITVGLWHKQPVKYRDRRVPVQLTNISPMDEDTAHRLISQSFKTDLDARQEKDLLWHMLLCPGCFDQYRELRHNSRTADGDANIDMAMEMLP